jgi:hypothetical protein
MHTFRYLEVDPCTRLLDHRRAVLEGFAQKASFKQAKLAQPFEVPECLFDMLIKSEQCVVGVGFWGELVRP